MTVIGKITISFVVFASVSLLSMIMSFDGLNDIKRAISRVSVVEEPISAAVYEMQNQDQRQQRSRTLNTLKRASPNTASRSTSIKATLKSSTASTKGLVTKEKEKQSGGNIGELYREYHRIGQSLMDQKEEQENLAGKIIESIEALDAMLDDRVPYGQSPVGSDGVKKTAIAGELGGNNAAVGTWLGHFLRTSKKEYRDRILGSAREFRKVPGHAEDV
jgi:hypothetical protein